MPKIHTLKAHPEPFAAVLSGRKKHEWRKDDRGYEVGDVLCLQEWAVDTGYTGEMRSFYVTYITRDFGVPAGWCCMSIEPTSPGAHALAAKAAKTSEDVAP